MSRFLFLLLTMVFMGAVMGQEPPPESDVLIEDFEHHEARWFAGGDFLLVQPRFSEAIAFAEGNQTLSTFDIAARPLDFSYGSSLRAFVARDFGTNRLQFTYWHVNGDTGENAASSPGRFMVDPFGNVVGTVGVIDPSDARFGGAPVTGGDAISAQASVKANLFDIDVHVTLFQDDCWDLALTAGARIADIDQSYSSRITNAGAFFSGGEYTAEFFGAGPRVGAIVRRHMGQRKRFSVFVDTRGALILGNYDLAFTATATTPGPFQASQSSDATRLIPVGEIELGASWRANDHLSFSAAYLFHSWWDLGASGGNFGGFYGGADDTNLMSFDGLVARAEFAY